MPLSLNIMDTPLLEEIVVDPAKQVTMQSSHRDTHLIDHLRKWNDNPPVSLEALAHDLIHQQALNQPEASAVCAWDGQLTYRELDRKATEVSEILSHEGGVGPEVFVPIYFEKSQWTILALLAVLKAGGAFVLLDPAHPVERLQEICRIVHAKITVTSLTNATKGSSLAPHVLTVDATGARWASSPPPSRPHQEKGTVSPRNAMYVVCTSGTTGKPKAVVNEHRGFCSSLVGEDGLDSSSRILQFASYAYVVAIWEMFTGLIRGACICIPSEEERQQNLGQTARRLEVTWACLTPSLARTLDPKLIPTLKTLTLGGEPITPADQRKWAPHVRLNCGLGQSECGPRVVSHHIQAFTEDSPRIIGRGGYGALLWIVDPSDPEQLTPIGSVGELLVHGPIVGRGYLGDDQRTAESFIQPPSWVRSVLGPASDLQDHRMCRTGDLVCYVADGLIEYIGRKDTQVKMNGQRLEPAEVEHRIRAVLPGSTDVLVLLVPFPQNSRLVAFLHEPGQEQQETPVGSTQSLFWAPSPSFHAQVRELKATLQQRVPTYMIPSLFLPLRQVPLNPSKKMDRKRLKQEAAYLSLDEVQKYIDAVTPKVQPSTDGELILQKIWSQVLSIPREEIGIHDHFFGLGGDSISAMKLLSLVHEAGKHITMADILQYPRIAELTMRVVEYGDMQKSSMHDNVSEYIPGALLAISDVVAFVSSLPGPLAFTPEQVVDILPTTSFQASCIESNSLKYLHLELPPTIDLARLEKACWAVVQHHPILRTAFIRHGDRYLQVVLRELEPVAIHLTADDDSDIGSIAVSIYRQKDPVTFSVLNAPVLQVYIVGRRWLLWQLNHAQFDGTFAAWIWADLSAAYDGKALQSLAPSYGQYLSYRKRASTAATVSQFWREYLEGSRMTYLAIPRDETGTGEAYSLVTNRETLLPSAIKGVPTAVLLQAAWAFALSQQTGERDLVFGLVLNGRDMPVAHVDRIAGPCITISPVRVTIDPAWTVSQFVQHVHEQHLRTLPHSSLELEDICPLIPTWGSSSAVAKFGTMLNPLGKAITAPAKLDGSSCAQGMSIHPVSAFVKGLCRLLIRTSQYDDRLNILMATCDSSISAEMLKGLMDTFVSAVGELGTASSSPLFQ